MQHSVHRRGSAQVEHHLVWGDQRAEFTPTITRPQFLFCLTFNRFHLTRADCVIFVDCFLGKQLSWSRAWRVSHSWVGRNYCDSLLEFKIKNIEYGQLWVGNSTLKLNKKVLYTLIRISLTSLSCGGNNDTSSVASSYNGSLLWLTFLLYIS